jgi:hypothetical protein
VRFSHSTAAIFILSRGMLTLTVPCTRASDTGQVLTISADEPVPKELPKGVTAVVFGPGEHRMQPVPPAKWPVWTLPDSVKVHVPMDTVLYFALQSSQADNITLEGLGSISGEEMQRCPEGAERVPSESRHQDNRVTESCTNNSPQGLALTDFAVKQASVRGVTFIDFPNHHIIAGASNKPCGADGDTLSVIENVKVMGWRANGDGIHVFGHWLVKDVFLRTQDDSLYLQVVERHPCGRACARMTSTNTTDIRHLYHQPPNLCTSSN